MQDPFQRQPSNIGSAASGEGGEAGEAQRLAGVFSILWLLLANAVGVLLATLLVLPELGRPLGEFTYGRWVPLHLNWQLYGWCALPAVAALMRRFAPAESSEATNRSGKSGRWVVYFLWSAALLYGGWSWLHGQTTGKLFLDWNGRSEALLLLAMVVLWWVLLSQWRSQDRSKAEAPPRSAGLSRVLEAVLLAALAAVPVLLSWSGGRGVYPPIDPGTGGPTGTSLLGSTLVVVLLFALIPWLLRVPARRDRGVWLPYWLVLGASMLLCWAISNGNSSHSDWRQISGLGSLLFWIPMLPLYWRRFDWGPGSTRWLRATQVWWAALVLTGFVAFLPGMLDRIKFGNVLVAHTHLAMAGFLTSLNMLILMNLSRSPLQCVGVLDARVPFYVWHAALAAHLCSLAGLGIVEIQDKGRWLMGEAGAAFLWIRLGAGVLMVGVSVFWLVALLSGRRKPQLTENAP